MSDAEPHPPTPDPGTADRPPPAPAPSYLQYTSRPPPLPDDAVLDLLHAVAGAAVYLSLLVAMKAASIRYRWEIGGVCGAWLALLIVSVGASGWMAGAYGWRGALVGVALAAVASLFFSAVILRSG